MERIRQEAERNSTFELLRIFAMFIIVFHHEAQHGLWFAPDAPMTGAFVLRELSYGTVGAIGNWVFILVSGYFISASSFSWKKVFRLWFQVFSISVIVCVAAWIAKISVVNFGENVYTEQGFFAAARTVSRRSVVQSFLPCYFGNNWFAVAYLVFFLCVPLLDKLISSLSRKEHFRAIVLLTVLGTVVPLLPMEGFYRPSAIFTFILGFFVARYVRLYDPPVLASAWRNALVAVVLFVLICVYKVCCIRILPHLSISCENVIKLERRFFDINNSLPLMLIALCLLCAFRSLAIPYNRFINLIASTTFGVYLFHENLLINKWWWHAVCKLDEWLASPFLLAWMLLCALGTFAFCAVLELVRKQCVERPLLALIFHRKTAGLRRLD